jgi:hypothetical protein
MHKNFSSFLSLLAFCCILLITSCRKHQDAPVTFVIDKGIVLDNTTTSAQDSFYVTRSQLTANLRVYVNTSGMGINLKRLYVFSRTIDNSASPGNYQTVAVSGFSKDGNNNFYYPIPVGYADSLASDITVTLRANNPSAVKDEFYFVYTTDTDYAGPQSTANVLLGPAQFFVIYGKLYEYRGYKLSNFAPYFYATSINVNYAFDIVDMVYKNPAVDPLADIDISENTNNSPLFLGKFTSYNGTTFVKADSSFPYGNATDIDVAHYFSLGTPFVTTPDSIGIGDIYLVQLRGDATQHAVIKITYIKPENGKTGPGYDNEYFLFNIKK